MCQNWAVGAVTYRETVQQRKKVAIICNRMPKSINLSTIKRKLRRKTIVYHKTFSGVNSVITRIPIPVPSSSKAPS